MVTCAFSLCTYSVPVCCVPFLPRNSSAGSLDDGCKIICVHCRSADKSAVDVRHGKKFNCVGGLDASTILDAHSLCSRGTIELVQLWCG